MCWICACVLILLLNVTRLVVFYALRTGECDDPCQLLFASLVAGWLYPSVMHVCLCVHACNGTSMGRGVDDLLECDNQRAISFLTTFAWIRCKQ